MKKTPLSRLIVFVIAAAIFLCGQAAVYASASELDTMRLDTPDECGNTPFYVENMFPGDSVTKDFTVRVDHRDPITLYYHADIRPGYEKLAEVLMVIIEIPTTDTLIYRGLMRDMPNALEYRLESEKSVVYRITVYLETSVGNDYQAKTLVADFRWWYAEEPNYPPIIPPIVDGTTPTVVKPVAEKILNGQYPRGREFSFTLTDAEGNVVQTVRNRDGIVEFDTLTFTDVGIYKYTIAEVIGDDASMRYDPTVHTMTVDVERVGNRLVADVTFERDGVAYKSLTRFVNETEDFESEVETTTPETTEPFDTEPVETQPQVTEPVDTEPTETAPSDDVDAPSTDDVATPDNPKTGSNQAAAYVIMVACTAAAIVVAVVGTRRKDGDRI